MSVEHITLRSSQRLYQKESLAWVCSSLHLRRKVMSVIFPFPQMALFQLQTVLKVENPRGLAWNSQMIFFLSDKVSAWSSRSAFSFLVC
jgi:hypothetical protein